MAQIILDSNILINIHMAWSKASVSDAIKRDKNIYTPAKLRPWIQGLHSFISEWR